MGAEGGCNIIYSTKEYFLVLFSGKGCFNTRGMNGLGEYVGVGKWNKGLFYVYA